MIPDSNVGTLHALCYRALNCPTIAETKIKEWNQFCPRFALKNVSGSLAASGGVDLALDEGADGLVASYNRMRGRMIPREQWGSSLKRFAAEWEAWKQETGYFDFTDMIEVCLKNFPYPPGNARIFFLDEAQDSTPLQFSLVRSWGDQCEYFVLAGDDDQTLYNFTGANPDSLLEPIADDHMTVLKQSYRVPQRIHKKATRLIRKVKHRMDKEYAPTDREGRVDYMDDTYLEPYTVVSKAVRAAKEGKTIMILASCGYMLNETVKALKSHGAPFHNPYRLTQKEWNPLYSTHGQTSPRDLLTAFLESGIDEGYWTAGQFVTWASELGVDGALIRGKGRRGIEILHQAVSDEAPGIHTVREALKSILEPEAVEPALNRNIDWLVDHLPRKKARELGYALRVHRKHGLEGLKATPGIIPGTIHSTKGGEADEVFLFPDLSASADRAMRETRQGRDSVVRTFYVGMTRAKEALHICRPTTLKGRIPKYMEV